MSTTYVCPDCGRAHVLHAPRARKCQCGSWMIVSSSTKDAVTAPNPFAPEFDVPQVPSSQTQFNRLAAIAIMTVCVVAAGFAVVFVRSNAARRAGKPAAQAVPVPKSLLENRAGHATQLRATDYEPRGAAPIPPADIFELVTYPTPAGDLAAYVSPDPKDRKRRPAVVWAHDNHGGIGAELWLPSAWENDATGRGFRDKGFVLFCPSWRGENDNPGDFELFYGEVDDLLAAGVYASQLPYVDPTRVYVAGRGVGGTLALLAAAEGGPFRAAFCFGGITDLETELALDAAPWVPFDPADEMELYVRNPVEHFRSLRIPVLYVEGGESRRADPARRLEVRARSDKIPYTAAIITGGTHTSIVRPMVDLAADKIAADLGPTCNIAWTQIEVNAYYNRWRKDYPARRRAQLQGRKAVELTPGARDALAIALEHATPAPEGWTFWIKHGTDNLKIELVKSSASHPQIAIVHVDGYRFAFRRDEFEYPAGILIDFDERAGYVVTTR